MSEHVLKLVANTWQSI